MLESGGDLLTKKKYRYTLEINSEGKLALSRVQKLAELHTGLPLSSKSQRTEFDPNPDLDVQNVDFDSDRVGWPGSSPSERAVTPGGTPDRDVPTEGGPTSLVRVPRPDILATLRDFLDTVDDWPPGAATDPSLLLDIEPLVGASREEIVGALSEPHLCYHAKVAKTPHPAVPCSSRGTEMVYRFYRLPPGSRGGGPELHLGFDDRDRCEWASWLHTQ